MTPVTILYPHSSDELYGSDMVLLNLVQRLERDRFRPLVLLPTDLTYQGKLSRALDAQGVTHRALAMPVLRRRYFSPTGVPRFARHLLQGTRGVMQLARAQNVALIHSNTSAVWGGALAARRLNLPHVWHVHELITEPRMIRKLIAAMVNRYSTHVVAISQAVAQHLLADAPALAGRISVIYDAVDTQRFSPQISGQALRQAWGVAPDAILAGVVGRISSWKGQELFLQAFALAARQNPQLTGVIVGDVAPGEDWRKAHLQTLAQDLGIAQRILWPGYHDDAPAVMAALDVLVLASTRPEPFGMVVIEAMASGTPVIATAHGGPLESVVPHETGLLVPADAPQPMAAALQQLAASAQLRSSLGAAGRQRAQTVFGFQQHVQAFQALYQQLLAEDTHETLR